MALTISIKKKKDFNSYEVKLKDMTSGKLIALVKALGDHNTSIGNEILNELKKAIGKTDVVS